MNNGGMTILAHSPMASAVNELMLLMQAVTEEYSISVHSAVKELAEKVKRPIPIAEIKNAESKFDEMILDAASRLDSHRQWFLDEIRSLDGNNRDGCFYFLPSSNC
jgi:hypothetical protein